MPKKSLFEEDEQENPQTELRVNEEYARRFEVRCGLQHQKWPCPVHESSHTCTMQQCPRGNGPPLPPLPLTAPLLLCAAQQEAGGAAPPSRKVPRAGSQAGQGGDRPGLAPLAPLLYSCVAPWCCTAAVSRCSPPRALQERAANAIAVARSKARAALEANVAGGDDDESSDGEDDDVGEIDEKTQAQIFETLMKIRSRDASIYDKEAKFYSSASEEEEEEEEGGPAGEHKPQQGAARPRAGSPRTLARMRTHPSHAAARRPPPAAGPQAARERPMYLKDVIYKQAMEGGADASDDDDVAAGAASQEQPRSYTREQRELKQAFLQAFEQEVEGDNAQADDGFAAGVLQQRSKRQERGADPGGGGSDSEGGEAEAGGAADARVPQLLDSFFGRDEQLSADDRFLKRYILNKVGCCRC